MNNKNNADLIELRALVSSMVDFMLAYIYDNDGVPHLGYTQSWLAVQLDLTPAQMSRVASGVSTLNTLGFYKLLQLVRERSAQVGVLPSSLSKIF